MAEEPEDGEIGVEFAVHHGFEIELDEGLAREADVVAQEAQAQAVGDEPPEAVVVAVEELLHEAVRAGASGAGHAGGALIERHAAPGEMDRGVMPEMGDRIGFAFDLEGGRVRDEPPVAEFLKEREEPAFARDGDAGFAGGEFGGGGFEMGPAPEEARPGAVDGFIEALAGFEVIVVGLQSAERGVATGDAGERLGGEKKAFGLDGSE
ncbi:MAG: hypothetical protein NTX50_27505 [Candidatus Sumerlaeota bacterium]|nr:hypothetical protein [Candidatus Sumerlaeota bacterium]